MTSEGLGVELIESFGFSIKTESVAGFDLRSKAGFGFVTNQPFKHPNLESLKKFAEPLCVCQ